MAKLTKKEKEKLERQLQKPADRGPTWVGYRPNTIKDKTRNIKAIRRENKKICKEMEE